VLCIFNIQLELHRLHPLPSMNKPPSDNYRPGRRSSWARVEDASSAWNKEEYPSTREVPEGLLSPPPSPTLSPVLALRPLPSPKSVTPHLPPLPPLQSSKLSPPSILSKPPLSPPPTPSILFQPPLSPPSTPLRPRASLPPEHPTPPPPEHPTTSENLATAIHDLTDAVNLLCTMLSEPSHPRRRLKIATLRNVDQGPASTAAAMGSSTVQTAVGIPSGRGIPDHLNSKPLSMLIANQGHISSPRTERHHHQSRNLLDHSKQTPLLFPSSCKI
jgi:hypothetical protein